MQKDYIVEKPGPILGTWYTPKETVSLWASSAQTYLNQGKIKPAPEPKPSKKKADK